MKVIVFGATGKTGLHVCREALEQGHAVTAFSRSRTKIEAQGLDVQVAEGNVNDAESVSAALAGQDAAIVALGSNGLRDRTTLSVGTRNVVDGMTKHGVGRLVVLSAAGVGESWGQTPLIAKIMFRTLLRNIYADHAAQESVVMGSSLDWTIGRAAILKDGSATGECRASNDGKVGPINRADVARFLVKQVDDAGYSRQAISVTG